MPIFAATSLPTPLPDSFPLATMIVDFTKLSPGGNDTIIVQSPVPAAKRATLARTLMSNQYVGGEQVGYLTPAPASGIDARLDMMGGELCVNGLRSAATVVASQTAKTNLRLSSSGNSTAQPGLPGRPDSGLLQARRQQA